MSKITIPPVADFRTHIIFVCLYVKKYNLLTEEGVIAGYSVAPVITDEGLLSVASLLTEAGLKKPVQVTNNQFITIYAAYYLSIKILLSRYDEVVFGNFPSVLRKTTLMAWVRPGEIVRAGHQHFLFSFRIEPGNDVDALADDLFLMPHLEDNAIGPHHQDTLSGARCRHSATSTRIRSVMLETGELVADLIHLSALLSSLCKFITYTLIFDTTPCTNAQEVVQK